MRWPKGVPGLLCRDGAGGNRLGWINWFCALEGHEFLVEIDEDFIRDPFNIYGLQTAFPNSNK